MKYHLLFNSLEGPARPLFKCGKDYNRQKKLNQMSMDFQREENQKDRDFNSAEAEKQRAWQSQEWLSQYEMQRDEWYRQLQAQQESQKAMFDYQAEYNSPQNQAQRLASIGLNQSALLGGQGSSGLVAAATGNVSGAPSPSTPTGGTVSGSAAHNQSSSTPNINTNPMADYSAFGQFLKDLNDVFVKSVELRPQIKQIMSSVTKNYADAELTKVTTEGQRLMNYIQDNIKDITVKKAAADLEDIYADVLVKKALSGNYDADTLFKKAQTLLTLAKEKCTSEEYKIIAFNVAHLAETWQADINLKRAQASEASTQATENTMMSAKIQREVAEARDSYFYRKEKMQLDNQNQRGQNEILLATIGDAIGIIKNNGLDSDIKIERAIEDLRHVTSVNQYEEWKKQHENIIANSPVRWILDQLVGGIVNVKFAP